MIVRVIFSGSIKSQFGAMLNWDVPETLEWIHRVGTWTHNCGVQVNSSDWRHPQYRWCVDQDGTVGHFWPQASSVLVAMPLGNKGGDVGPRTGALAGHLGGGGELHKDT